MQTDIQLSLPETLNPLSRQPENPFHPGEYLLEEFLEPAAISQAEFARRTGNLIFS